MRFSHALLLTPALLCTHCTILNGDGIPATTTRQVPAFTAVTNELAINLVVTVGERGPVTVACDKNLLRQIKTEVVDGTLVVTVPNGVSIQTRVPCHVEAATAALGATMLQGSGGIYVHADEPVGLESINSQGSGITSIDAHVASPSLFVGVQGSGDVDVASYEGEEATIRIEGSGNAKVRGGRASTLSTNVQGSGNLVVSDLVAVDANASISGSGSAALRCTKSVDARIDGSGSLTVFGSPAHRTEHVTGSGEIVYR